MRKVILALAFVALVAATQADVVATIKRIDATPFGRTLFDTVWLEL